MQNLFSLEGRVALVTGGSRGIGAMIVKGFLTYGAKRVYITARKASACDAAAEALGEFGECVSLPGDVSTMEGIQGLADRIKEREDKLDILVNNAGAAWGAAFDEFPEAGWDKTVDLNMKTPFFLTQALIDPLRAAAKDHVAKVINIASIDGQSVTKDETYPYGASKAGLLHMTKRMALRLAADNIAVSCIAPGARTRLTLATPGLEDIMAPKEGAFDMWDPANISPLVAYLSTADCAFTGETFFVQGGNVTRVDTWAMGDQVEQNDRWTVAGLAEALAPLANKE